MKIGIIGAGRLGICFALLLEKAGYDVIVSDCRDDYVAKLNDRIINTNEPKVSDMLDDATNFVAVQDNIEVIKQCDIIYTLVATPSLDSGVYDVSSVWQVIEDIKKTENVSGKLFVVGCTTNPGDCELFENELSSYGVSVAYNPEFIAQGSIVDDLQNADLVLIGGKHNKYTDELKEIYRKIQFNEPNIVLMSTKSAELTKIAINCFLTSKISFANMIGDIMISSGIGDEIDSVLYAIGSDDRVGTKYLKYGHGFGGPCFPRDNRSFAMYSESVGCKFNLGRNTDNFNKQHLEFLTNHFVSVNKNNLPYYFDYISYKKGTDIIVESQQYELCKRLLTLGHVVYICDNDSVVSQVKKELEEQYDNRVKFVTSASQVDTDVVEIKF